MNASIILQTLIIVVCVAAATAYTLRNVAPKLLRSLRGHTAPVAADDKSCSTGSDAACSSCGNCGSSKDAPPKEHKLVFHERR